MKSAKFLLDINALLALGMAEHEFHGRVARWISKLSPKRPLELATCSFTELGFVRVLANAPQYSFTVAHGKELLARMKGSNLAKFSFLSDSHGASQLLGWVRSPGQITDGHLLELAESHGFQLATLDQRIPGALLIPKLGRAGQIENIR